MRAFIAVLCITMSVGAQTPPSPIKTSQPLRMLPTYTAQFQPVQIPTCSQGWHLVRWHYGNEPKPPQVTLYVSDPSGYRPYYADIHIEEHPDMCEQDEVDYVQSGGGGSGTSIHIKDEGVDTGPVETFGDKEHFKNFYYPGKREKTENDINIETLRIEVKSLQILLNLLEKQLASYKK